MSEIYQTNLQTDGSAVLVPSVRTTDADGTVYWVRTGAPQVVYYQDDISALPQDMQHILTSWWRVTSQPGWPQPVQRPDEHPGGGDPQRGGSPG